CYMAYISIYRKYRPYDFDGIVGQEHIVRILRNQIKTGTIGHAYLFTGTRGTGKTSIAKIFARAVNCTNNDNGQACGKCDVCMSLANANNLDIIEIDAASNNGVDEIRELRESVKYPPAVGRFKVYIIDEVHMLSIGAFNALLKTLEEPPSHVIFILATTEVHKLPQTILSRCLRFDFRLVPTNSIASRIKYIFDDMGIKCTQDACLAISEAGDGSVRDALSIADMCVSYGEGNVDYNVVLDVLGQSNPNIILDIIDCTLNGDISTALTLIDNLSNYGKSMSVLARDITKMFRNLFIVQNVVNPEKTLSLPSELIERLKEMRSVSSDRVLQCVDIMSSVEANMRYSSMPRTLLESSIAKCADPRANIDLTGVVTRLKSLEDKIANGNFNSNKEVKVDKKVK
ncbi:MAG: DNA polymerase III subunit gamma/tau, partial [Clostridia bacterium]|nr:DNA polymerase III subunit gamma/tau [Clostridia bacterium]